MSERVIDNNESVNSRWLLPESWNWSTLDELGLVQLGKTPSKSDYRNSGDYKIIKFRDVDENGVIDWDRDDKGYVDSAEETRRSLKELQKDDVLVTASAHMSEHIGKKVGIVNKIPKKHKKAYFVGEILQIRVNEKVEPKWIFYFLQSSDGYKAIQRRVHGVHLIASRAKNIEMPLAAPSEQKLIVSEIEKQFSRLDEAVAALNRIKANLKHYKASVLKAAVEGKLTEEWRKQHPDVEPASELLKRIFAERRKKWEKEHLGKKYKDPSEPDTSNLPELPKGWVWARWETILSFKEGAFRRGPFGSSIKKSFFVDSGYKVYEQYCPINDDCSFGRYFISKEKFKELEAFSVRAKDFLISCSGTMGRITQVPEKHEEGVINQALLRVRINNQVIDDIYFKMLFRSPYFQKRIFDNATGSAIQNVKGVNELKAIPLPLPPLEEQKEIIKVIEESMSVILEVEKQADTNLKRAERLRQSILKKAFSGRLVRQAADDDLVRND